MKEALPILLGFGFGYGSLIVTGRRSRAAFAAAAIGCVALAVVVISGELRESWAFGLVDLLETALGFVAGCAVAFRFRILPQQN